MTIYKRPGRREAARSGGRCPSAPGNGFRTPAGLTDAPSRGAQLGRGCNSRPQRCSTDGAVYFRRADPVLTSGWALSPRLTPSAPLSSRGTRGSSKATTDRRRRRPLRMSRRRVASSSRVVSRRDSLLLGSADSCRLFLFGIWGAGRPGLQGEVSHRESVTPDILLDSR